MNTKFDAELAPVAEGKEDSPYVPSGYYLLRVVSPYYKKGDIVRVFCDELKKVGSKTIAQETTIDKPIAVSFVLLFTKSYKVQLIRNGKVLKGLPYFSYTNNTGASAPKHTMYI